MQFKRLILALALILGLTDLALARTMIVVLPADSAGSRDELLRLLVNEATAIKPGNRLIVYDARTRKQIATIAIPDDPKRENRAWLLRQIAMQFAAVRRVIEGMPVVPVPGEIPGNLYLPDILNEIGRNVLPSLPTKSADLLLIGSMAYFDVRDGRWSMTDRFYPSDSHLKASPADTPFSTIGREMLLAGATIHLCSPRNDFATKDHEALTTRWWSLYLVAQGARVGTISFDLPHCFRRMRAGEFSGQATFTASDGLKLEMLRAHAAIPAVIPLSQDRPGEYFLHDHAPISKTPPSITTGVAWIGLKWKAPCDIDLYARSEKTNPWLFFGNTQSADGRFNKDHRSATGESNFEFIEFVRPIDLAKAEVVINLYEGQLEAAPEGVVRVWFDGRIYEAPFKIGATRGNKGAPPMSGSHWIRIDLLKVVGLAPNR